jgi:predicted PurR-regulated permease PerM
VLCTNAGGDVRMNADSLVRSSASETDERGDSARPRRRAVLSGAAARAWLTFAGWVLIIAVLRWAQAVAVPIALAVLLTFLLNGPVTFLARYVRRPLATGVIVTFTLACGLVALWSLASQVTGLANELPAYRQNIRAKVADIRGVGESPWLQRLQSTLDDIQNEMRRGRPKDEAKPTPVVVADAATSGWGLPAWGTALFAPMGTMAVVFVFVTFMLLEYASLRDRVLAVVGDGYLANTTKAFDEAASRLSRYLAMQLLVNSIYGTLCGLGLWAIGVPYPFLWGVVGGVLRFVPYVGPWIGASLPIITSVAVFPRWHETLWAIGLMVGLELFTNLVLETVLYAGAAGVSQVALLIAIAFWTWLWGPIGLLLGMPLTVCLVVLAKHTTALSAFRVLMTDAPALSPDQAYYQRLLAGQAGDAASIVEEFLRGQPADEVYDAVLLPALNYARRDRHEKRISSEAEHTIADGTVAVLSDLSPTLDDDVSERSRVEPRLRVLGYPAHGATGEAALQLLAHLCRDQPIAMTIAPTRMLVSEMVAMANDEGYQVVCLADLPPHSLSKVRYAISRLRQHAPHVKVLVGRWAPAGFASDLRTMLLEAGATDVATSLVGTRSQLLNLAACAPSDAPAPDRRPVSSRPAKDPQQAGQLQQPAPIDLH